MPVLSAYIPEQIESGLEKDEHSNVAKAVTDLIDPAKSYAQTRIELCTYVYTKHCYNSLCACLNTALCNCVYVHLIT